VKLLSTLRGALWTGASLALLAACSAGGGKADGRPPTGGGGAGGEGNPSGTGGSSAAAGASSIGVGSLLQSCGTSALARPQLRRLTASELQHSLDDIFPQAKGQWSIGLSEVESPLGFNNDPALLSVGQQVASKLLSGAQSLASVVATDTPAPADASRYRPLPRLLRYAADRFGFQERPALDADRARAIAARHLPA
jgi:hypothetical protein